jgi:hypothetical protein
MKSLEKFIREKVQIEIAEVGNERLNYINGILEKYDLTNDPTKKSLSVLMEDGELKRIGFYTDESCISKIYITIGERSQVIYINRNAEFAYTQQGETNETPDPKWLIEHETYPTE